jgi:hypothetical protein
MTLGAKYLQGKSPRNYTSHFTLLEGSMQYSPTTPLSQSLSAERRPYLVSFDSGHECSLEHWLELSWLVEHEEELDEDVFEDCLVTR